MAGLQPRAQKSFLAQARVWWQLVRGARQSMALHRVRTLLGTVGFLIGIGAIVAVQGVNAGMQSAVQAFMKSLGPKTLHVMDHAVFEDLPEEERLRLRPIRIGDAEHLARSLRGAKAVAPYVSEYISLESPQSVKVGDERIDVEVIGTTESWLQLGAARISRGRFLAPAEVGSGRLVAVVGSQVASRIAKRPGTPLFLNDVPLDVVGVFQKRGTHASDGYDNFIVIPMSLFANAFGADTSLSVGVVAKEETSVRALEQELVQSLRAHHQIRPSAGNDFRIVTPEKAMTIERRVIEIITSLTGVLVLIVLVTSGGNIMSVVYVAVSERQKELGILQALGMRPAHVVGQFVIESALVSMLGAAGGLFFGWLLTLATAALTPIPASMSLRGMAIAVGYCLLTGTLAGLIPAWRAARLTPAAALREE